MQEGRSTGKLDAILTVSIKRIDTGFNVNTTTQNNHAWFPVQNSCRVQLQISLFSVWRQTKCTSSYRYDNHNATSTYSNKSLCTYMHTGKMYFFCTITLFLSHHNNYKYSSYCSILTLINTDYNHKQYFPFGWLSLPKLWILGNLKCCFCKCQGVAWLTTSFKLLPS